MTADPITVPTEVDHCESRAEADRLAVGGDLVGAVDLLQDAFLRSPDPITAERLIHLRAEAGAPGVLPKATGSWPPRYDDPFPDVGHDVLPEVPAAEASLATLAGGVEHHGAVIIRGAMARSHVDRVVEVIRSIEEHLDLPIGAPVPDDRSYQPFDGLDARPGPERTRRHKQRHMVARQGGCWLADSPVGTAIALGALWSTGLIELLTEHFGSRPLFSLQKATLRRSRAENRLSGWHQDGSFLGPAPRTMNVWTALSPCGGDRPTPGLEVIPTRVDEILPTDGDLGQVAISPSTVAGAADGIPGIIPEFEPGDALIFDQYFVHRSHFGPDMDTDRFALECWTFASGHAPEHYIPLLA